jgi:hypothetical protein
MGLVDYRVKRKFCEMTGGSIPKYIAGTDKQKDLRAWNSPEGLFGRR